MGRPNCSRTPCVGHRLVEHGPAHAEGVEGDGQGEPGRRDERRPRPRSLVNRHTASSPIVTPSADTEATERVSSTSSLGLDEHPGRGRIGAHQYRLAVGIERHDQQDVGGAGVEHEARSTVQPQSARGRPETERRSSRHVVGASVVEGHGQGHLPRGNPREQVVAGRSLLDRRQRAAARDDGAQVGARGRRPPELLEHHRHLGEGRTGPAEPFGQLQAEPTGVRQPGPVRRSRARPATCARAGAGQQVAGHGPQLVVELAERHRRSCHRRLPRQTEAALADDRPLDLARPAGDRPLPRADEVEHPCTRLPAARDRLAHPRLARRGPPPRRRSR